MTEILSEFGNNLTKVIVLSLVNSMPQAAKIAVYFLETYFVEYI